MGHLIIFLSLYFCIYGAAHLYLLIKWRRAFYLEGFEYLLLFISLVFLMLAPINGHLLETQGHWLPALVVTWIGFLWLGFVFIYICLSLPLDGYHLLVGAGQGLAGADWTAMMLSRRQNVVIVGVVALCLMGYGAVEAYRIRIENVTIHSSKITSSADAFRIVQISDAHLGPMLYPGRLEPMIRAMEMARPDILVCTGDLIDGRILASENVATRLRGIKAPLGKYAVTGNHEFYYGIERSAAFIREAGFTLLRGKSALAGSHIAVIGVDDPAGGVETGKKSEAELLADAPGARFRLLLKHRPSIEDGDRDEIDLQLSGHTHQGQIFPFGLVVRLFYPLGSGLHAISNHGHLYTSRGTGTWGPPVRILAPPEITVIDVVPF